MSFLPRSFETIRDQMISYIQTQTLLTDFEIGAIVRTMVEGSSLEDDEQYFQMVQLLDAFNLSNAVGSDLDGRLQEFGILRLHPKAATSKIVIRDENLVKNTLLLSAIAGATSLTLSSSSAFPTAGYPYTVKIGEGTLQTENVLVSNNNTTTNTMTVGALVAAHASGERVAFVSGAADQIIATNLSVQRPATLTNAAVPYVTTEPGTLANGTYESTAIRVKATSPGAAGNSSAGKITSFTSSPPFNGASVTNITSAEGGAPIESDDNARDRGRQKIQSLSNATVLAITQAAIGITDVVTGQSVTTANLLEDFVTDTVNIYIDDGTGFSADAVQLARTAQNATILSGVSSFVVTDSSNLPGEGYAILSPENPAQIELVKYTNVTYTTNTVTTAAITANGHDIGDEVALVELVSGPLNAESGQNFFQLSNFPVVINSDRVWVAPPSSNAFVLLNRGTQYKLNQGNGQLKLVTGLTAGSKVAINYNYYTGLIQTVQKVIEGSKDDTINFPGFKAAGIIAIVQTPVIRRIAVRASISAINGFVEANLIPQVKEAIEVYINGLGIGDNIVLASIIDRAMNISGMYNITINSPTSDIVILENELPVPFDASGNSLTTVI